MTNPDSLPPLSDVQLEIMDIVWKHAEVTLGEVWKALSEHRSVTRSTIQTQLTRLVEKGWLQARPDGKVFHYRATCPRTPALQNILQRLANAAFRGSTEGVVLTLLEGKTLDKEEADRIRAMIDRAERGQE
jgi:predicted transcriptional regulator